MNRSVTIVLGAVVVWTTGLNDTTEVGLQPQEDRQTEISSVITTAIPEIVGDYVLIYKPQAGIYTGKDRKHYKAGQTYTNWQPNDHTFIKGPDNRLGTIIGTHPIIDRRDGRKSKERNGKRGYVPIKSEMKEYYPAFSWETVPVGFHFGKTASVMTDEEAQFVASHASFICLEKGHASEQFRYTEEGIEREAQQLRKYNPNLKVIFYWNTFLDYPMYQAHEEYQKHPEWWLRKLDGTMDKKKGRIKRYDLSNPEVRDWWTDVAKKAVIEGSCDGVFMDAFPQISAPGNKVLWGIEKYNAIQEGLLAILKETRLKIGDNKLIFYNGIRSTPSQRIGNDYAEFTDAVMIEHFGYFQSASKECMLADIQAMTEAGRNGKIVVFKAWPGFAWIDRESMQLPLERKREIAAKNITFPSAAFLVGAQENSYFIYNWGYRMKDGCLEWYPEFDEPLGEPLGDMVRDGWTLSRQFKHASVWVNLETREADIQW